MGFGRLALSTVLLAACAAPSAAADDGAEGAEAAQTTTVHAPADPEATAETKTVLANLHSFDPASTNSFDHRVLVGQQETDTSNRTTNGLEPVDSDFERTAHAPAGLVSYEISTAFKGALGNFDVAAFRAGRGALRERILAQHAKGVLVSLVWHMKCPKASTSDRDLYSPEDCPRDYTLASLLQGGAHFAEWRAMLDELAELLWSLKDANGNLVPVQIRPFHEFGGNWFWWGRSNAPDTYAQAWREMVDYLRNGRGLHNVLWVFCPGSTSDDSGVWRYYPGDRYVDVVAIDRYDFGDGRFARGYEADLRTATSFARAHDKVAAVAEVGRNQTEHAIDPSWFSRTMLAPLERYKVAYVALWRNAPWEKFVPEPNDGAATTDFEHMTADEHVLLGGKHDLYSPLHR